MGLAGGFLSSRVSASNNREGFVPKDGDGAVTHRARTDPTLPVRRFPREVETFGTGTSSDDHSVRRLWLSIFLHLAPVPERTARQVDLRHRLRDDVRAKPNTLFAELVHEFRTKNTRREPGKVLHVGGSGELAASGEAVSHEPFEKDRLEVRAR